MQKQLTRLIAFVMCTATLGAAHMHIMLPDTHVQRVKQFVQQHPVAITTGAVIAVAGGYYWYTHVRQRPKSVSAPCYLFNAPALHQKIERVDNFEDIAHISQELTRLIYYCAERINFEQGGDWSCFENHRLVKLYPELKLVQQEFAEILNKSYAKTPDRSYTGWVSIKLQWLCLCQITHEYIAKLLQKKSSPLLDTALRDQSLMLISRLLQDIGYFDTAATGADIWLEVESQRQPLSREQAQGILHEAVYRLDQLFKNTQIHHPLRSRFTDAKKKFLADIPMVLQRVGQVESPFQGYETLIYA